MKFLMKEFTAKSLSSERDNAIVAAVTRERWNVIDAIRNPNPDSPEHKFTINDQSAALRLTLAIQSRIRANNLEFVRKVSDFINLANIAVAAFGKADIDWSPELLSVYLQRGYTVDLKDSDGKVGFFFPLWIITTLSRPFFIMQLNVELWKK